MKKRGVIVSKLIQILNYSYILYDIKVLTEISVLSVVARNNVIFIFILLANKLIKSFYKIFKYMISKFHSVQTLPEHHLLVFFLLAGTIFWTESH